MPDLVVPRRLKTEFATVQLLLGSPAATRATDALAISWIKYEKQLRRLFCFLVFQHPAIDRTRIDEVIAILVGDHNLNPTSLIAGIAELGVTDVPQLLGARYTELAGQMERIREYRNKIMHGQVTGLGLQASQLERDILWIVEWMDLLGQAAHENFGYDGIQRNTFIRAKAASSIAVNHYPFAGPDDFLSWLTKLTKRTRRKTKA